VEFTLDYLVYGTPIINNRAVDAPDVLAISEGWQESAIDNLRQLLAIEPMSLEDARASTALGITTYQDDYLLGRTHFLADYPTVPLYQYVRLPREAYTGLSADLQPLQRLVATLLPPYNATHIPVAPLQLLSAITWTADKRISALHYLLTHITDGDMMRVFSLLDAALDGRQLLIRNFPPALEQRLKLVQGLLMLLPTSAFAALTFATNMHQIPGGSPRIVFSDTLQETDRRVVDWVARSSNDIPLRSNYASYLADIWHDDLGALIEQLREMDLIAAGLMAGSQDLNDGLRIVVARHQLDHTIQEGGRASMAALRQALDSSFPPQGKLRQAYLRQLLHHALDERDVEVAQRVAAAMDGDPRLDETLTNLLYDVMADQPDAVYVFVRARLSTDADELDARWLKLLHESAVQSLQIAITQGDIATLANWLKLIAREPLKYGLTDILHDGILAAQPRAHEDGELGEQLIRIAVRRAPDALEKLLQDQLLLNTLPDEIGAALRDRDTTAIELLAARSREIFLLALVRAAEAETEAAQQAISAICVQALWEMLQNNGGKNLPERYQPSQVIRLIIHHNIQCLSDDALETLLALMLMDASNTLFMETAEALAIQTALFPALVQALQRSQIGDEKILEIIGKLTAAQHMTWQQVAETYTALLEAWGWQSGHMPIVEQFARILQQHPEVTIESAALWNLLDIAHQVKSDVVVRPVTRRLAHILPDSTEDDAQLIQDLLRLRALAGWHSITRKIIQNWWRKYTREQSIARLQKLYKLMDGHKPLEDLRTIVQTTLALRKLIGQRSLEDFAQDVSRAYTILEAFSDAFDPTGDREHIAFDQATVRAELEDHLPEISAESRHILATNLKELTGLIASMSDNRSKPSLIRSDESLARQLVKGEYQPQSAIDVMKWLSGYLEGSQPGGDEE